MEPDVRRGHARWRHQLLSHLLLPRPPASKPSPEVSARLHRHSRHPSPRARALLAASATWPCSPAQSPMSQQGLASHRHLLLLPEYQRRGLCAGEASAAGQGRRRGVPPVPGCGAISVCLLGGRRAA